MWSFIRKKLFIPSTGRLWTILTPGLSFGLACNISGVPTLPLLHMSLSEGGGSSDVILPKDEFSRIIKEKTYNLHEKYKNVQGVNSKLMIWSVAGSPDTHSIELKLPKDNCDVVGVMAVWMGILSQQGGVELHSQTDDGQGGKVVSFVSSNPDNLKSAGNTSMTIKGLPNPSVTLFKDGGFSVLDVNLIIDGYERILATSKPRTVTRSFGHSSPKSRHRGGQDFDQSDVGEDPVEELRGLGIEVYKAQTEDGKPKMTWDNLAGYNDVKKEIIETILIPLKHPDVYDKLVKYTREYEERNRPKAILLEGPPGTGKTLTAKIIACECDKAMVHLPVESIASKWYGESEKKLSQIFDACDKLGGAIIFIDEIDSLVGSRDNDSMHEATRRILSVILQRVEGFQGGGNNVLIGATNRKKDLDAALISRFDTSIRYKLPDYETRQAILKRYAKQLGRVALHELAKESEGFSSRDLKELCEQAERKWAAEVISKSQHDELEKGLPSSTYYMESLQNKRSTLQVTEKLPTDE